MVKSSEATVAAPGVGITAAGLAAAAGGVGMPKWWTATTVPCSACVPLPVRTTASAS
ncbi:MAG: hypothetical protein ACOCVZ_07110 [Gemmatimonadota bacterium]